MKAKLDRTHEALRDIAAYHGKTLICGHEKRYDEGANAAFNTAAGVARAALAANGVSE